MIHIVGDGVMPEAKAFYDVRDALKFDCDVYLAAMLAPILGIELKGKVIYNLEPLYDGCRSFSIGYLEVLKRNIVLDYDRLNVEYLKQYGIEAFYMPYGYNEKLTRTSKKEKDIDVLLVGSRNERREKLLKGFDKEFNFVWSQGVYGAELDDLISRAKVHLNVHYCDSHPLEVVRLNYLMANHCCIVSEIGNDDLVNEKYSEGLIFSDDLMNSCKDALKNPIDGYECIKKIRHDCTKAQEWIREVIMNKDKSCLG